MLDQLTCKKCDCERSFLEKDGIFTCQSCGTQYSTDYIVAEIKQKLARDIIEVILHAIEDDIADEVLIDSLKAALSSFVNSDFKETESHCDAVIESDEENYAAWLLKGEAICFQLVMPVFERSAPTAEDFPLDVHLGPSSPSPKFLGDSIIPLQSALFNTRFERAVDCFVTAINTAPTGMIDDVARICLSIAYNEVLFACLQMLLSLIEVPILDSCSAYTTEKAHLMTIALRIFDTACRKRLESGNQDIDSDESKSSLDWDTCARWLSRNEFNSAIKVWENEVGHYRSDYDGHPPKQAMLHLIDAVYTATAMIDLFLLSDPLDALDMDELNFSLDACDRAIAMCQEAKEFKCYQKVSENGSETYEAVASVTPELFDARINKLYISRERVKEEMKRQSHG